MDGTYKKILVELVLVPLIYMVVTDIYGKKKGLGCVFFGPIIEWITGVAESIHEWIIGETGRKKKRLYEKCMLYDSLPEVVKKKTVVNFDSWEEWYITSRLYKLRGLYRFLPKQRKILHICMEYFTSGSYGMVSLSGRHMMGVMSGIDRKKREWVSMNKWIIISGIFYVICLLLERHSR